MVLFVTYFHPLVDSSALFLPQPVPVLTVTGYFIICFLTTNIFTHEYVDYVTYTLLLRTLHKRACWSGMGCGQSQELSPAHNTCPDNNNKVTPNGYVTRGDSKQYPQGDSKQYPEGQTLKGDVSSGLHKSGIFYMDCSKIFIL